MGRRGGELSLSFSEFYEPEALMMEEEGMVIVGLLVGLNVLDANLCLKGEDLDSQVEQEFVLYMECLLWARD